MPDAMKTPTWSAIAGVTSSPASSTANCAAASANWMKTSIFLTSFFSTNRSGIEALDLTRDPRGVLRRVEAGDRPDAAVAGQERVPVCLRSDGERGHQPNARHHNAPAAGHFFDLAWDSMYSMASLTRRNLLGVVIGDLDPEFLFECHHELDGVERIRAQIVHERGVRRHFLFVDSELLHDDALHLVCYGHSILQMRGFAPQTPLHAHSLAASAGSLRSRASLAVLTRLSRWFAYMYMPPLTARTCPVIYAASSDARKQTADATSSGEPIRRSGILDCH